MVLKRHKILTLCVAFILAGTGAYAAKVVDVSLSVHNFSVSSQSLTYKSVNEEQVCIFCHTPHNADSSNSLPMWNRVADESPGSGWVFYNSTTLTNAARPNTVGTIRPESLMCLSCHDGSVAINSVINESNITGPITMNGTEYTFSPDFFAPIDTGPRIGSYPDGDGSEWGDVGHLEDDHPISFSYIAAIADEAPGALHPADDVRIAGLKLYGGAAEYRLECGTCHDPHVSYDPVEFGGSADTAYTPFLRIPNTNSAMCLTCHNK